MYVFSRFLFDRFFAIDRVREFKYEFFVRVIDVLCVVLLLIVLFCFVYLLCYFRYKFVCEFDDVLELFNFVAFLGVSFVLCVVAFVLRSVREVMNFDDEDVNDV